MDFTFERGSADNPRGHALIYFQNSRDASELLATYLVILPIQVDVSKYVPPFLMNQLGEMGAKELSAFAFPPAPEVVSGMSYIQELAQAREDDIIFGGTISTMDVTSLLGTVNEAIGWYADLCSDQIQQPAAIADEIGDDSLSVNDVLYGLMSDQDKLNELTRLVGPAARRRRLRRPGPLRRDPRRDHGPRTSPARKSPGIPARRGRKLRRRERRPAGQPLPPALLPPHVRRVRKARPGRRRHPRHRRVQCLSAAVSPLTSTPQTPAAASPSPPTALRSPVPRRSAALRPGPILRSYSSPVSYSFQL